MNNSHNSKNNNTKKSFLKEDDQHEDSSEDQKIGDYKSFLFLLKYANAFKFKFISRQTAKSVPPLISNNAKINLIPKTETKELPPPAPKKVLQKSPQILTKKRPYKEEDLIKQVEDEMEDMMNEMKTTNFN